MNLIKTLRNVLIGVVALACAADASAQVATTTSLAVTTGAGPVSAVTQGAVVTLTATVSASGAPVSPGQVVFCDATATYCTGTHLIATTTLTSAGTALLKFRPGVGNPAYRAVFLGTNAWVGSSSNLAPLKVTGNPQNALSGLVATGLAGDYTLTATMTGSASGAPTGQVSFQDLNNSNYVLGTATLAGAGVAWTPVNLPMPGAGAMPHGVALGDYNGDGILDMAATDAQLNHVVIWLGKGDGTFQLGQTLPVNAGPSSIVAGDFNGDGKLDLMVAYVEGPGLSLLLGNGDGTFGSSMPVQTGNYPGSLAVGDFNGDGRLDVAAADYYGKTLAIVLGNGDGTFAAPTQIPVNGQPIAMVAVDVNGDGKLDVLLATEYLNDLFELLGKGDGTFTAAVAIGGVYEGAEYDPVATGDFNGDGKIDLVVPYGAFYYPAVALGNGDGTFSGPPSTVSGFIAESVAVGDFNGDGIQDVVVGAGGTSATNYAVALTGNGDGTFMQSANAQTGPQAGGIAAGDLNGDGLSDVVIAGSTVGNLTIILSKPIATATVTSISPVGTGTHFADAIYAGDANYLSSTSNQVPLTARLQATSLGLGSDSAASTAGQAVTLTATVSPFTAQDHTAMQSVSFYSDAINIGTAPVTNGSATLVTSTLPIGTDNLTAMYEGDVNFAPGTSGSVPHKVTSAQAPQTITFPPLTGTAYAGISVYLNASASSDLPVTYTVLSGPAAVSGSILTYTGAGTVMVEADQAGDANYGAATPVKQNITVVLLTALIGAESPVVGTVVSIAASGTLGNIGLYLQGASNLDFRYPGGTCTIGKAYTAGQSCTVTFIFTPTRPGLRYGGITLSTTAGDTLGTSYMYGLGVGPQIVFTPATQSVVGSGLGEPDGVAIDGNGNLFVSDFGGSVGLSEVTAAGAVISFSGLGVCYDVTVDGNGNVFTLANSGSVVDELIAVNGSVPANPVIRTITTTLQNLFGMKVDTNGNLFLASSSGTNSGSVYEIVAVNGTIPASPTILTLTALPASPSGVALDASGDVFVSAGTSNGGAIYEIMAVNGVIPPTPVVRTIAGTQLGAPSNIGVDADGDLFVSDDDHATIEEVLAVNGVVPETNPTIVTVGSNLGLSQGLVLDPSGVIYIAVPSVTGAIKLDYTKAPTLTFASTPIGSTSSDSPQTVTLQNDGNAPLTFTGNNPTISTGFSLTSSSTCPQTKAGGSSGTLSAGAICTESISFMPVALGVDNGTLDITDDYLNSTGATQTVLLQGTGLPEAPTIVFQVSNKTFGDPPFMVAATSNSTGAFTYSVVSGPATISGNIVTLTGAGNVTLMASEAAAGNYAAGAATTTFSVAKKPQTITFNALPMSVSYSTTPIPLVATASSGLPVIFSIISGPGVVSGSSLTSTNVGKIVIAANQPGDAIYAPAPQVEQSITISGGPVTVTLTGAPNPVFLHNPVTLTASVAGMPIQPTGTVTYFEGASPLGTATVGSNGSAALSLSTLSLGMHSIYAVYDGDSNFSPATSNPVEINVEDFSLTVSNANITIFHGGTATYNLLVSSVGGTSTAATIAFALSGEPEGSSIVFTPQTLPINSIAQNVSLAIKTPDYPVGPWSALTTTSTVSLGILLAGFFFIPFRKRARNIITVAIVCVGLSALNGCGSGWRTQVWQMQVTANAGNLSHTATLNLTSVCKDGAQSCPVVAAN